MTKNNSLGIIKYSWVIILLLFANSAWAQDWVMNAKPTPVKKVIIQTAQSLENVPYVFGGDSEQTGLDCSAYVQKVFGAIGLSLPRTAKEQSRDWHFELVPRANIQTGDLIFFKNTYKPGISHVGIMLDKTHMMHASRENGVVTEATLIHGGTLSNKIAFIKRLRPDVERKIDNAEA